MLFSVHKIFYATNIFYDVEFHPYNLCFLFCKSIRPAKKSWKFKDIFYE